MTTDHEQEETMHAAVEADDRPPLVAVTGPVKLTAARLARVEELQAQLRTAADLADALTTEEENGWVPGQPGQRSHRVEPLEAMSRRLAADADALEALYS